MAYRPSLSAIWSYFYSYFSREGEFDTEFDSDAERFFWGRGHTYQHINQECLFQLCIDKKTYKVNNW